MTTLMLIAASPTLNQRMEGEPPLPLSQAPASVPRRLAKRKAGEEVANPRRDYKLIDICKQAAAKHVIEWPNVSLDQGGGRDLYDGRRLPPQTTTTKPSIPVVASCLIK